MMNEIKKYIESGESGDFGMDKSDGNRWGIDFSKVTISELIDRIREDALVKEYRAKRLRYKKILDRAVLQYNCLIDEFLIEANSGIAKRAKRKKELLEEMVKYLECGIKTPWELVIETSIITTEELVKANLDSCDVHILHAQISLFTGGSFDLFFLDRAVRFRLLRGYMNRLAAKIFKRDIRQFIRRTFSEAFKRHNNVLGDDDAFANAFQYSFKLSLNLRQNV